MQVAALVPTATSAEHAAQNSWIQSATSEQSRPTHTHPHGLRPQSINTTPPAEHNEDNASLNSRIASLQIQVGAANATIAELNTAIDALYEHIAATIADSNEVQSGLRSQLADAQAQRAAAIERVASLEAQRAEHLARLRELDIRDDLQVEMGDAGQIVRLKLNDIDALQESETRVKVGGRYVPPWRYRHRACTRAPRMGPPCHPVSSRVATALSTGPSHLP